MLKWGLVTVTNNRRVFICHMVRWYGVCGGFWQGLHFLKSGTVIFFFSIFSVGIRLVGVWEIFLRASVLYSIVSFVLLHLILVHNIFSSPVVFVPYSLDLLIEDSVLFCTMISHLCGNLSE